MPDPRPGTSPPPYQDILDGNKTFIVTHPDNRGWDTCPFRPPTEARPVDWADQCIANARGVGFLEQQEKRPNEECPAGWFLCKGMCYVS